MPGIYGVIGDFDPELETRLTRLGTSLRQGRVEVSDCWADPRFGIGLGRESLGIFHAGRQPIFTEDKSICLVMEGEFYDSDELKRDLLHRGCPVEAASDPELALHLYQAENAEGLSRAHGLFSIAVWDVKRRELVLVNDRFGLRPIYYHFRPDRLIFSSDIKGLLAQNDISRVLDYAAVADFFASNYVIGDKTLFQSVRLVPAATILRFRDGQLSTSCYWPLLYEETENRLEEELVDEFIPLLVRAVERRLSEGKKIGLPLSGGLDSRLLLAVAKEILGVQLPAFTYGERDSRDVLRGSRSARTAKVPHRVIDLEADYIAQSAEFVVNKGEGMQNCLEAHGKTLAQMTDCCQIMMLGNPGGALFGTRQRKFLELKGDNNDPIAVCFQIVNKIFKEDDYTSLLSDSFHSDISGLAYESFRSSVLASTSEKWSEKFDNQRLRESSRRHLLTGLNMVVDQLEFTEPYYDYELVNFVLRLPLEMRWKRNIQKTALIRISPRLARVPGGPLERKPTWILKKWSRGKRRFQYEARRRGIVKDSGKTKPATTFNDYHTLLRQGNRNWIEEILLGPQLGARGFFRPEAVKKLVDDHMNMEQNIALQLGTLATFELFHRQFID